MLFVPILAVVEYLANWRIGIRSNLNEIEIVITSPLEGLFDGHDVVVAVRLYDTYLVGTNFLIYAKFVYVSDNSWESLSEERDSIRTRGRDRLFGNAQRGEKTASGTHYTRNSTCEVSVKIA